MVEEDLSLDENVVPIGWDPEDFFLSVFLPLGLESVITKEVGSFWPKDQNREFSESTRR